ncbi:MAG: hypothetical protein ACFFDH_02310 [Promethearchaeota archaeon]
MDDFDECSICFEKLENTQKDIKPKFSIGIICKKCSSNFNPQEKEILIHAFNVARGIFQFNKKCISVIKDVLFDVQAELKNNKKRSISLQGIFQKILIRSQVYGLKLNIFFYLNYHFFQNQSKKSNCDICNQKIKKFVNNKECRINNHLICENCIQKFPNDEINTMISLFKKFGGYFNELKENKVSLKQILENMFFNLKIEEDFSEMIEINERALHFALLYGYPPKLFIEKLKKFYGLL